jgi:hypothetical protein
MRMVTTEKGPLHRTFDQGTPFRQELLLVEIGQLLEFFQFCVEMGRDP